jgi:hypothetical protein
MGNIQGFSNQLTQMKRLFVQQCQNSDVKKINWWPARSHLVVQVFASLPNILGAPPDAPLALLAASSVSELCLETCVNVLGRDALLVKKPNNDSLVVVHPLIEIPEMNGRRDNNSKRTADVMLP